MRDYQKEIAWEAARLLMHQYPTNAPKWWRAQADAAAKAIYREFGEPPIPVTSAGGNYYSTP